MRNVELQLEEAFRGDQCHDDVGCGEHPVERYDPNSARAKRAGAAMLALRRRPHDESGDHEEQIDADGAEVRRVVRTPECPSRAETQSTPATARRYWMVTTVSTGRC